MTGHLHTHYCEPRHNAYSDCSGHDEPDLPTNEIEALAKQLESENIVMVRGQRYVVDELTNVVTSDGHRYARLAPVGLAFEFGPIPDDAFERSLAQEPF